MNKRKSKYDSLDLMKFILSLFVIALHVQPIRGGYEALRLISRLAVPLFFITSGFFYFMKIKGLGIKEQNKCLKHFLVRGLRLYISWMVLLLPFTIYYRQWFRMGFLRALISFVMKFFFGSTFIASWYLMALMIGITAITYASRGLSNKMCFLISFAIYLLCCAWSGYGKLLGLPIVNGYPQIYNSFPVSFIWLMIGKLIAENNIELVKKTSSFTLIVATAMYVFEYVICVHNNWANNTDSLVFMIPICTILFILVKDSNIILGKKSIFLRHLSTVSYCLHASVSVVLGVCFKIIFLADMESSLWMAVRYISTITLCVITTIVLQKIERYIKFAGWLY